MLAELVEIFLGNHHNLQQLRCLADELLDGLPDLDEVEWDETTAAFVGKTIELALFVNTLAHNSDCMVKFAENYLPEAFEIAAFAHFPVDEIPDSPAELV